MKKTHKKYRIKDIAALAGVSPGTVDRVLHNRGEVSENSREKILKILKEIDYQPNVFASTLASKKTYTIACILPQYVKNEYFEAVENGISQAEKEFSDWNILIKMTYFDQFDEKSFQKACDEASKLHADAILFVPTFKDSALAFISRLDKEVPYVFLDSQIKETNPLAYFGQESYQSGYLAAKLLSEKMTLKKEVVVFRMMRHSHEVSNQTYFRELGFAAYLRTHHPEFITYHIELNALDEAENYHIMDEFWQKHPEVASAVIFNSRAYIIGEYFQKRNLKNRQLVGYDLLKRNIACLKDDSIQYLIGQRPEKQGYNSIKAIARYFVLKQPVKTENFMPMDILTKENIDFFIDFEQNS